jgi:hypothetical protein
LPNIIKTIKSRRMRWAVHVAYMGAEQNAQRVLWKRQKGRQTTRKTWMKMEAYY